MIPKPPEKTLPAGGKIVLWLLFAAGVGTLGLLAWS
jgi:hypothetical protein